MNKKELLKENDISIHIYKYVVLYNVIYNSVI